MKKICLFILALVIVMNMHIFVFAEDETIVYTNATGVISMTEEELGDFKESVPQIVDVNPNSLYYERVQNEYSELLENDTYVDIVEDGEEIVSELDVEALQLFEKRDILLPTRVDNSENNTFPIIGDQDVLGACTGWTFAYYQLTNNANKLRGTVAREQNKNIESNVYSPNWLYNLGNGGEDNGMSFDKAIGILYTYGCPTIDYVPLNTDGYLSWYPQERIWEKALYNKCDAYYGTINPEKLETPITGPNSSCLRGLKTLLADGYVVSVSINMNLSLTQGYTGDNSCENVWTEIKVSPDNEHALTIVGYDDNFRVDLNHDGEYELAEYGAFKIANSWGQTPSSHNNGFIWLAYDALNQYSSVRTSNYLRRKAFIDDMYYVVMPQKDYKPLMTATLDIESRYQCILIGSIGIEDANNPEKYYEKKLTSKIYTNSYGVECEHDYTIAFNNRGGLCNLFGTSGYKTGTVVFDLSPLLQKFELEENHMYNIYVKLKHSTSIYATSTIKSFVVTDHHTDKLLVSETVPAYANQSNMETVVNLDYVSSVNSSTKNASFTLEFNSDLDESTVNDENVKVLDSRGHDMSIDLSVGASKKAIHLSLQNDVYDNGFYTIKVLRRLKSKGGNGLSEAFEKMFYVPFY